MRKYLKYLVIAFIVFYVLSNPAGAAGTVHQAFGQLKVAGGQLTTFVNSL